MKLLVLGGTHLIGRHIAEQALAKGHEVTIFNRGQSLDQLPAPIERLRGDRDKGKEGLKQLEGRRWDACVDVSGYTGLQVSASAELLCEQVGRYIFVSAVAVYGEPSLFPVAEGHATVPPAPMEVTHLGGGMYSRLKVTCEGLLEALYKERLTVLRPQVVVGPYDASARLAYWLTRAAQSHEHAAPMLAPGDGTDPLQVIDGRDLAAFALHLIEEQVGGVFNVAGESVSWREVISLFSPYDVRWVSEEVLEAAGLSYQELPLYRGPSNAKRGLMQIDHQKALRAGLSLRPLSDSLAGMKAWMAETPRTQAIPQMFEEEWLTWEQERALMGHIGL